MTLASQGIFNFSIPDCEIPILREWQTARFRLFQTAGLRDSDSWRFEDCSIHEHLAEQQYPRAAAGHRNCTVSFGGTVVKTSLGQECPFCKDPFNEHVGGTIIPWKKKYPSCEDPFNENVGGAIIPRSGHTLIFSKGELIAPRPGPILSSTRTPWRNLRG